MRRRQQLTTNFIFTLLSVDPADFSARGHDAAQGALGQGQHAVNHVALFFRKGALRNGHRGWTVCVMADGGLFAAAHQAQDGIRGPSAAAASTGGEQSYGAPPVKELDNDRETDRRVQIPF